MIVKLIVDNRELKLKDLFITYSKDILLSSTYPNIEIIYENLEYGDFVFEIDNIPCIIMERKTLKDLASSVKDTRYRNQKINLLSKFNRKNIYYIIEGNLNYNNESSTNYGIPKDTLISCIINCRIRDDIKIFETSNITDTFDLLTNILLRLNKDPIKYICCNKTIDTQEIQIKNKKNISKDDCFKYQLSQIPSISYKSAAAIITVYPSMCEFYKSLSNKTLDEKNKLLSNIYICDDNGKKRKISTKTIKNIIEYMF